MRQFFLLSLLCTGFASLFGQMIPAYSQQKDEPLSSVALRNPAQLEMVIKGNNIFAFDLYQQLKSRKGNLLFSSYSIVNGLTLLGMGAKGTTGDEMSKALNYPLSLSPLNGDLNAILSNASPRKGINHLLIASAAWIGNDFVVIPAYLQAAKQNFNSDFQQVNFRTESFAAIKKINQWVSNATKGKINQLLGNQDVNSNTKLVLTAAIYMNGNWQNPFDLRKTKKAPFYLTQKHSNQVDMMQTVANFSYNTFDEVTVIELPYEYDKEKGAALSLYVILPHEIEGIEKLEQAINNEKWSKWVKELKPQQINLSLPRFRDDEKLELNQPLQSLGIHEAFTPNANFTGISLDKGLFLSQALHKTYIRVDEKGTEAAASTGLAVGVTSIVDGSPVEMVVDHPFIYIIADKKTGSILFVGRMSQP